MCSIRASVLIEAFLWQALYYPPCQKIQAMQKMTFSRAIHMIPWPLPCSSRPLVENMQKVIKQTIQHSVQLFLFSFSIFCLTSPVFYSHNLIICLSDFISQPEILILLAYFKHLKSIIQLSAPFFIFQCFFFFLLLYTAKAAWAESYTSSMFLSVPTNVDSNTPERCRLCLKTLLSEN